MADEKEQADVFPVFDFGTAWLQNGTVMVRLIYAETHDQMAAMKADHDAATTADFMLTREQATALAKAIMKSVEVLEGGGDERGRGRLS